MPRRRFLAQALSGLPLITHAPAGAPSSLDLAVARRALYEWSAKLLVPGKPYGCYRGGAGQQPDLYASLDMALLRLLMGEDLRTSLTRRQRGEWVDYINSYADPADGSYQTFTHHSKLHANGMVIGALGALGGRMKYRVRLYEEFNTPEKIAAFLEKIDWRNQWTASHLFWGGVHCFSLSRHATSAWLDRVFEWLNDNLDPATGWWRQGVPHADRHQPLGGSVHILPIYQHHRRRFPYPERLIDSVLALQLERGNWLAESRQVMTYLDLDALYALRFASATATGYRRREIREAVTRYSKLALAQWEQTRNEMLTALHPHYSLAVIGTLGLLQHFDPRTSRDRRQWSDIFSDRRLYQTSQVEA